MEYCGDIVLATGILSAVFIAFYRGVRWVIG